MLTKENILKFVEIRNASTIFTNLQFQIDAEEAGFKVSELGTAIKRKNSGGIWYKWETPFGTLTETPDAKLGFISKD